MVWDTWKKFVANYKKWYTTSQEFTIDDAKTECNKNKNTYKDIKNYDLKKFFEESRIMTVIFTSQPFKGNPNNLPNDCLIIAKSNFGQINDVGDIISEAIHKNRLYKNADEVIKKNKTFKTTLEKARIQLEDCSFALHSFFLDVDENDLMMVDEYNEV
ncbi:hypothetical protein C1646_772192 [Rhizophagus diaphanus]|nr:hypothetical protein C1646_772192 [Rhizophagus diaphanus] [Rhizophagus sp. MUCL 43196]